MKERNLCTETGCPAACCKDMFMYFGGDQLNDIKGFFPEVVSVDSFSNLPVGIQRVYCMVSLDRKIATVYVKGDCPNLDREEWDCKIRERRPKPCVDFKFGSAQCNKERGEIGIQKARFVLPDNIE